MKKPEIKSQKQQIMLRIVSFIVIQAFLLVNMSWAASELVSRQSRDCLSPSLQMNRSEITGTYEIISKTVRLGELAKDDGEFVSYAQRKALDAEVQTIVHHFVQGYDLIVQQIQMESNREFTPEQAIGDYAKNFIEKAKKKKMGPVTGVVVGLGASGKTTFLKMLKAFYDKLRGTVVSTFDHNILPKNERPIDPVTKKTTEDVTKKFQIKRQIAGAIKNIFGRTAYTPLFDVGPSRARLKFGYEDGNIIIRNGSLRVTLKKDKTGEYLLYTTEDGEEEKKGEKIELGSYIVHTRKTAQNEVLIGIGDSEYVVAKNKVGLDTVDLIFEEELGAYQKEHKKVNPETIFLKVSEQGTPVLEYKAEQSDAMRINTLQFKIEKKEEENILFINGVRSYIPKDEWGKMCLVVGRRWYHLQEGKLRDFLQRFLPGTGILLIEGIGVTASEQVNSLVNFGFEVFADPDITMYRRGKRAKEDEKKEMDVAAVLEMKREEDAKYVIPWIEQASGTIENWIRVSSQSIAESLWVRWKQGTLDKLESWCLRALNIDINYLISKLNAICKESIEKQLFSTKFLERERVVDDPFPATEFYPKKRGQYGIVLLKPLEKESFEKFKEFYKKVLKPRMGDLMVKSAILDFSENQKSVIVDVDGNRQKIQRFGEVLVKKATWMSVESRLIEVLEQKGMKNEDKVKLIESYLRLFFKQQKAAWKIAGVVDKCPHFHKYSFPLTPDNHGKERVILNHFKDLTDESQDYDFAIYKKHLRQSMRSILSRCSDKDLEEKVERSFSELVAKNVPDNEQFRNEYFAKERDKAWQTSPPYGLEAMEEQIKYMEGLLEDGKKFLMHRYYQGIREYQNLRERQALLCWISFYHHYVSEYSLEMADAAFKLYNIVLRESGDLDWGKLKEVIARIFDPEKKQGKYNQFLDDISLWQIEPYSLEKDDLDIEAIDSRIINLNVVSEKTKTGNESSLDISGIIERSI
ncbi:MAG: hypothetical protein L6416_02080 [Candidatus Omnitrophica bacterium]|nr:hypothetical protein [Candidatus Omnitrophota bacterium]